MRPLLTAQLAAVAALASIAPPMERASDAMSLLGAAYGREGNGKTFLDDVRHGGRIYADLSETALSLYGKRWLVGDWHISYRHNRHRVRAAKRSHRQEFSTRSY